MIYLDTETCGLHGMPVLLQYAEDEGEIKLYSLWKHKVHETITLLEWIINHPDGICGFNLSFDWFHIAKIYTTFLLFKEKYGPNAYPDEHIDEIAVLEKEARDGPCIKPYKALDLMLHARKGPFQSLMNRDDIRIKKVPTALAWELAAELKRRVPLDDIFFARNKDGGGVERFKVYDIYDEDEELITDFKDIVCKFSPSTALKALAVHALGVKEDMVLKFKDIECTEYPEELGWAPFALALGVPGTWNGAWPQVIRHHIRHWAYNDLARQYASNDITYTRGLKKYFEGPEHKLPCIQNDDDSVLACMVAVVRWRGLKVNIEGIKKLREEAIVISGKYAKDGKRVKEYLQEVMTPEEYVVIQESTKKVVLEDIVKNWRTDDDKIHPAAVRAKNVLDARRAKKEVELYDKLITAGRFHCSFVVIGTKSSRMSGNNGLNPQGINHQKKVRSQFPFAWDDLILCGGDFSSFEVSLAAAVYKDNVLDEDLKLGKKMAGLFGQAFFPDLDYDEIIESDGEEVDHYDRAKRAMYQTFYGGTAAGISKKIGFDLDVAEDAFKTLTDRYKGIGREQKLIGDMFGAMTQPDGIGSKVIWKEPSEFVASPLGFKRYFTLENRIAKALFDLANKPPDKWKDIKIKVVRRDRLQTAGGATQSALYGSAFQILAANIRAAANHRIQCFGSQITKAVQCTVWEFQPCGIHVWFVMPFNCHDEVDAPCKPEIAENLKTAVIKKVESYKDIVPFIKMKWDIGLPSWKSKG